MFDWIKRPFKIRAKSFEELVKLLEGCESVTISPTSRMKGFAANHTAVGTIGDFRYLLVFTATAVNGRRIVYQETKFERSGSTHGFADATERMEASIRLLLDAEARAQELRISVPGGIEVDVIGPNNKPMDRITFNRLHQDAAKLGVGPS